MMRRAFSIVALAGVLCGCTDREGAAAADGNAKTGEGGKVPIVESAADLAVPAWRVSPEPLVEVGGPDAGFVMVAAALRTGDGFVTADAGTGELRFYDARGRPVRRAGGTGRGPGEFQHIGWMNVLQGDSLAVWDPLLRRLSVFTPDDRYVRSFAPAALNGFFPNVFGSFADGSLLVSTGMESASGTPTSGAWRDTMVLIRVGRAGEVVDTLGRFPGPSRYALSGSDGVPRTYGVPFGPTTSVAMHADEIYVATGERYEITVLGPDGRPRRIIRSRAAALPVTRRERESFAANMLQAGGSPEEQRARQAALESAPFPRTMAAVEALRVDSAGNLWVREPQAPDTWNQFSRWSVFDREGHRIAKVEAPGRFTPHQIGGDWVLGRKLDADGTHRVRLYRLNR
jgi:hypothetical protein